jgi:uncharacterized protein YdhG (YjbR/CyaY superfamily)
VKTAKKQFETIDEYIATFPEPVQKTLQKLRQTIKDSAPEAKETVSYQMPAFKLNGILVYFAVFKNHIGFYPTASGISNFEKELTQYETSKGTIKFPIDKPIPLDLIRRIVTFRVKENMKKQKGH